MPDSLAWIHAGLIHGGQKTLDRLTTNHSEDSRHPALIGSWAAGLLAPGSILVLKPAVKKQASSAADAETKRKG